MESPTDRSFDSPRSPRRIVKLMWPPVFELVAGTVHRTVPFRWVRFPYLHKTITHTLIGCVLLFGGAEGNRTPVRKQLGRNFSGRSLLFTFPYPGGNKHPTGFSSFMMHGMGKAYHTHVLHSTHTRARLVDLPGRMGA